MDAERRGRPRAVGSGHELGGEVSYPVALDGSRSCASARTDDGDTGSRLVAADTPIGFFAAVDPCTLLRPGDRLAPLNAALLAHLDATHGTDFGPLRAAPEVR